eukprot:scaffold166226_cov17-Tisochrysis_lutea.AAC.1
MVTSQPLPSMSGRVLHSIRGRFQGYRMEVPHRSPPLQWGLELVSNWFLLLLVEKKATWHLGP